MRCSPNPASRSSRAPSVRAAGWRWWAPGPAGLACAHGLARAGHDVVIFEARAKGGGLNEYGIASYKATGNFAQAELDWLLSIGGIELRTGVSLGGAITLEGLRADFDAVFLGLGLAGVNTLGIPEPAGGGPGRCGGLHRRAAPGK